MRIDQLNEDLVSAGLPIIGIQRSGNANGKVGAFSTITWDGGLIGIDWATNPTDVQKVQAQKIADAHAQDRLTNSEKLKLEVVSTAISDLLNGVGTDTERLQRVEKYLVKILRYLRRENID